MPVDIRHFPGLETAARCLIGLYSEVISIAVCGSMGMPNQPHIDIAAGTW